MYKKQLKIQKIVCLLAVVVAVILFLYALGIMTDLYDNLYDTLRIRVEEDPTAPEGYTVSASERIQDSGTMVYFDMQAFDKVFVNYSIIYIVLAALLFVTNTSTRRKYYISNYIAIGLFTAASIYLPILAHTYISYYKALYLQIDFAAVEEYMTSLNIAFKQSTLWFDLHYVVMVLMFLIAAAMVGICVWKIMLMRDERKLLEEGKKVKA